MISPPRFRSRFACFRLAGVRGSRAALSRSTVARVYASQGLGRWMAELRRFGQRSSTGFRGYPFLRSDVSILGNGCCHSAVSQGQAGTGRTTIRCSQSAVANQPSVCRRIAVFCACDQPDERSEIASAALWAIRSSCSPGTARVRKSSGSTAYQYIFPFLSLPLISRPPASHASNVRAVGFTQATVLPNLAEIAPKGRVRLGWLALQSFADTSAKPQTMRVFSSAAAIQSHHRP